MSVFSTRKAGPEDCALILQFIRSLAEYEKMLDAVTATEELLKEWLFEKQAARVIFACEDGREVGFALYYFKYSTFVGRGSLHLEDLFVYPEYRGKGYGKSLLQELARIARLENCGRMDWTCLDWNEPSIKFYRSLGAKPMDDWTIYRLTDEGIDALAATKQQ